MFKNQIIIGDQLPTYTLRYSWYLYMPICQRSEKCKNHVVECVKMMLGYSYLALAMFEIISFVFHKQILISKFPICFILNPHYFYNIEAWNNENFSILNKKLQKVFKNIILLASPS